MRDSNMQFELELFREFERAELRRLESQRATPTRSRPLTNDGTPRR